MDTSRVTIVFEVKDVAVPTLGSTMPNPEKGGYAQLLTSKLLANDQDLNLLNWSAHQRRGAWHISIICDIARTLEAACLIKSRASCNVHCNHLYSGGCSI